MSGIIECSEPVEKPSVGEEFIKWAEQYWRLKDKYDTLPEDGSESIPYEYVKHVFSKKIDDIIKEKLNLY